MDEKKIVIKASGGVVLPVSPILADLMKGK